MPHDGQKTPAQKEAMEREKRVTQHRLGMRVHKAQFDLEQIEVEHEIHDDRGDLNEFERIFDHQRISDMRHYIKTLQSGKDVKAPTFEQSKDKAEKNWQQIQKQWETGERKQQSITHNIKEPKMPKIKIEKSKAE